MSARCSQQMLETTHLAELDESKHRRSGELWGVLGFYLARARVETNCHECKSSCSSVTFVLGAVPEANEGASLSALTSTARIHTAVSHASTHSAAAFLIEVYFCRAYTAPWVTCSLFVRCHLLLTFNSCFSDRFGRQIADGRPQKEDVLYGRATQHE